MTTEKQHQASIWLKALEITGDPYSATEALKEYNSIGKSEPVTTQPDMHERVKEIAFENQIVRLADSKFEEGEEVSYDIVADKLDGIEGLKCSGHTDALQWVEILYKHGRVRDFKYTHKNKKDVEPIEVAEDKSSDGEPEFDGIKVSYYNEFSKECFDMMEDIWGREALKLFCEMNAFKYRMRMGNKEGQPMEKDLIKVRAYIKKRQELA